MRVIIYEKKLFSHTTGELELHFENGTVFKLSRGDSLYFDSAVGHVYLSTGAEDAEVLVCCVDNDPHRLPETL